MNFKEIHIGNYIKERVEEEKILIDRIVSFFKTDETEILKMYESPDLSTNVLLKWSKLLEYDFFRIYSHHLILYAPVKSFNYNQTSNLPRFRKNVYSKHLIDFVLEQIEKDKKTKQEIIEEYRIPKTTLYKWLNKYSKKK